MIRNYALCAVDNYDDIIDRYVLDVVENPTGNGFKLKLSTINGDVEDIITKVVQAKATKNFNVIQHVNPYVMTSALRSWIQSFSSADYKMLLEYNDTKTTKYCEGKVTALTVTEKDEFGIMTEALEFTMTTPDFFKRENKIVIKPVNYGKKYPYVYPYSYGASSIQNNEIDNIYIADVPLILTINGISENPTITLVDENNKSYNTVKINATIQAGEKLIINSAQRKIIHIAVDGTEEDYVPNVDPSYDTFLRAKHGKSKIVVNAEAQGTGFEMLGGWRQYTL